MHLLQSNVDLNMIRSWLGHASIETTNSYVEIDPGPVQTGKLVTENPGILAWLSAF